MIEQVQNVNKAPTMIAGAVFMDIIMIKLEAFPRDLQAQQQS